MWCDHVRMLQRKIVGCLSNAQWRCIRVCMSARNSLFSGYRDTGRETLNPRLWWRIIKDQLSLKIHIYLPNAPLSLAVRNLVSRLGDADGCATISQVMKVRQILHLYCVHPEIQWVAQVSTHETHVSQSGRWDQRIVKWNRGGGGVVRVLRLGPARGDCGFCVKISQFFAPAPAHWRETRVT